MWRGFDQWLAPTDSSSWEQITSFPDGATHPALSPDGRMLAFVRGENQTLGGIGQVYLKLLPDGDVTPITSDQLVKLDPAFSPDGQRVAYSVVSLSAAQVRLPGHAGQGWDTWVVPVLRGETRSWLRNASGLTWVDGNHVLFSEITSSQHMGIVTASEDRSSSRPVYFPSNELAMAHRSARSPDGSWVLVVEMDERGVFMPCRLIPFDGSSSGRPVGPTPSRCTNAAWAPDGRWMYFAADLGEGFHIWRQRFPNGSPERITGGAGTQEEGVAVAPDGASLITSVGQQQRGVWIHDASGDRQVSLEGYAYWPLFSGRTLCFRVAHGTASGQSQTELWMTDLASGRTGRLFPGQMVTQYDLSHDGRVVASVLEADNRSRLWIAPLDGREPPRRLAGLEGDNPRFSPTGDIIFRSATGTLIRASQGGGTSQIGGMQWAGVLGQVSPDGAWLTAASEGSIYAVPTDGGDPVLLLADSVSRLRWDPDGARVLLNIQNGGASAFGLGLTYVLRPEPGSMLPRIRPGGVRPEIDVATPPGAEVIPYGDVSFSPTPGMYAYSKITVTRNLYRVPLR